MSQGLIQFISLLTQEANEPMGTGTVMQPSSGGPETATERAIDQQLNDMAQSLQSKVMQFGEQEFWSHWFHRYQRYGTGTKMANIVGVKGVDSTEIELADFQTKFPPGVLVYSAKEAEYKELVLRRDLMTLYPQLMQSMETDQFTNFNKHVFFPKFLQDPSLIDIMFPKTLDEIDAENENEQLKKDDMPDVKDTDNHTTHIYSHMMVMPKTWSVWFHIAEHQEKLAEQKAQEMQAQQQQMMAQQEPAGAVQVGADKKNPIEAASPLKQEMQNSQKTNSINNK